MQHTWYKLEKRQEYLEAHDIVVLGKLGEKLSLFHSEALVFILVLKNLGTSAFIALQILLPHSVSLP